MKPVATLIVIIVVLLSAAENTQARWAETSEALSSINFEKAAYKIHRDGSYSVTVERQIEILKDRARTELGMTRLNFDAHTGSLRVLEARTINKDRSRPVLANHIEIKPLASSGPGFDVTNQLTVAYPDVSVGSKLYLKYRRDVKKAFVPGTFWLNETYGWKEFLQSMDLTLESELPLFTNSFDPEKVLEITTEDLHPGTRVRLHLKKPLFKAVVEEEALFPDSKILPWFSVTTLKTWGDLSPVTVNAYETTIHSPLPAKFEGILAKAQMAGTDVEKMNAVTSGLAESIRYVGDWVPVKGAFHPRALTLIAETGFGDCKDFSVSTAALLQHLGFTTHAAWISRGRDLIFSPLETPTLEFNHAIVWASKNGRDYWIDPTNTTSFAQGIYPDIADRRALILDPSGPRLSATPPMTADQGRLNVVAKLQFDDKSLIQVTGQIELGGLAILPMTGSALSFSKQQTDYMFVSWLANIGKLQSWKFDEYDLASRTVKDLSTHFEMQEKWTPVQTSAGTGYMVSASPFLTYFQFKRDQRVSGLQLSDPEIFRREYRFRGKQSLLKKQMDCGAQSPWVNFSRKIFRAGEEVVFQEDFELKRPSIEATEIQGATFAALQDEIMGCLQQAVIVFE